ncbi:hypothetical protein KR52_02535 [Synechococcus sp. KORDI-52]|nr:hypothetical protein KR52_02535 [Synechococcus sp. KORDI-52]
MQNMFNYNRRLDNTLSQVSSLVLVKESEIESPNQCNNKIQQISDLLFGKGLPDMNVDSIRNMNSLEQVKNFIDENFDSEEKLSFEKYDKTTHYHANHIKTKDYSINRESIDQESLASAEKANDDFISKYENTFCRYQPTEVTASTAIEILKALKITILPK